MTISVETKKTYRYELYRDDILTFDWSAVPKDANIYIEVPGGGDWSGMKLDTTYNPLVVTWSVIETHRESH